MAVNSVRLERPENPAFGFALVFPGQTDDLAALPGPYSGDALGHAAAAILESMPATAALDELRQALADRGNQASCSGEAKQLAALVYGLAFAELLADWGARPAATIGAGLGHLAALRAAGLISAGDALLLADRYLADPPASSAAIDYGDIFIAGQRGGGQRGGGPGLAAGIGQLLDRGCLTFLQGCPSEPTAQLLRQTIGAGSWMWPGDYGRGGRLALAGRLFEAGLVDDVARVAGYGHHPRARLPGYPFARRRHWFDRAAHGQDGEPSSPAVADEAAGLLHALRWRQAPMPEVPMPDVPPGPAAAERTWVVLDPGDGKLDPLCSGLTARGCRVLRFAVPPAAVPPDAASPDDGWRQLADRVRSGPAGPVELVHGWTLSVPGTGLDEPTTIGQLGRLQELGAISATRAIQALGAEAAHPLRGITLLTSHANNVSDDARQLSLAGALAWGVIRTAAQELPGTRCVLIDAEQSQAPRQLADIVVAENSGRHQPGSPAEVAYRGGQRLTPVLEPAGDARPGASSPLRRGGAYLITGGTGGIGLALAGYLVRRYAARLALVSRHATETAHPDLDEILAAGGEVLRIDADVTDPVAMGEAFRATHDRFGHIDGIFHLAGTAGFGSLLTRPLADFRAVLAPKVTGGWLVDKLAREYTPGFVAYFSSAASVLGYVGRADYAAANRFLDALAERAAADGRFARALDWGIWQDTGMAASDSQAGLPTASNMRPLAASAALSALEVALAGPEPRLVIADLAATPPEPAAVPSVTASVTPSATAGVTATGWDDYLRTLVSELMQQPAELISSEVNFFDMGLDSVTLLRLTDRISADHAIRLRGTYAFEHPTLRRLAQALLTDAPTASPDPPAPSRPAPSRPTLAEPSARRAAPAREPTDAIAIIGIACRFPGAPTEAEFWHNVAAGVDSVTEVPADRWDIDAVFSADPDDDGRTYSRWGAFLSGIDCFDPLFFGISPREASAIDPQHRIFLETAWQALEQAGYAGDFPDKHKVGVFAAVEPSDYIRMRAYDMYSAAGCDTAMAANRVSYTLDFGGPSVTLDAACASSALAIHLAVQSIRAGESAMAIAGGVKLLLGPEPLIINAKARLLSPTGRCRAFDAAADGYVQGEGAGVLVLKSLDRALRDGDNVRAVIRGSATNHDGGGKVGLSAPSVRGQAQVIETALTDAEVKPDTIGYVEAHGTGTAVGDPIEVRALTEVYRGFTTSTGYCGIGSVKSNIGHLEMAAGVAGVIKAVRVIEQGTIPPTLHVREANPLIPWAETPFFLPGEQRDWPLPGIRRAAVSSFGFGGSNVHLILEQAPEPADDRPASAAGQPIVLSAKSPHALRAMTRQLADHLAARPRLRLADIALTLTAGRRHFDHRLAIVVRSVSELVQLLRRLEAAADWAQLADARIYLSAQLAGRQVVAADGGQPDAEAVAKAYCSGLPPATEQLAASGARRVPLPSYPMERHRFWPEPDDRTGDAPGRAEAGPPASGQTADLYELITAEAVAPADMPPATRISGEWLIVRLGDQELPAAIGAELGNRGARVTILDDPVLADPVLADPVLADPVLADPVLGGPVLADPVLADAVTPAGLVIVVSGQTARQEMGLAATAASLAGGLAAGRFGSPRLLVVTSGAVSAPAALLRQAAVVLPYERPGMSCGSLEVTDGVPPSLVAATVGDQIASGGHAAAVLDRYGPRTRELRPVRRHGGRPRLSPEGAYLVTGAAGGLGGLVAVWLAERGARRIALLTRQENTARADDLCRQLIERGAEPMLVTADMSVPGETAEALAAIVRRWGPVAGIVHAAGRRDRQRRSMLSKTPESTLAVLAPKVTGTRELLESDAVAADGFVVLFSSLSALDGQFAAGQYDYAAANAFLDQCARAERARGVNCTSIQWPQWHGTGMAAHERLPRPMAAADLRQLPPDAGLAVLDEVLADPGSAPAVVTVVVSGRSWRGFPATRTRPLDAEPPGTDVADMTSFVTGFLRERLGLRSADLVPGADLADLGADSLAVADLVGAVEKRYGTLIDPSVVLEHSRLDRLCRRLAAATVTAAPVTTEPVGGAPDLSVLAAELISGRASTAEVIRKLRPADNPKESSG